MNLFKTKILSNKHAIQINQLWNDEFPVKLKDRFPILLNGTNWHNHYIIINDEQNVMAWAVDFEKENQIRFSIIVATKYKYKGIGAMLIEQLKAENNEFYGWIIDHNNDLKSNGEHYQTPMPFYLKHEFEILNDIRIDSDMIKAVLIKWSKNDLL